MKNSSDKGGGKTPGFTPSLSRGEEPRILLLSLSGIGNLLMQLPTIEALKKAHPPWHITVSVAPRGTKEIASSQPYIDEVIEMPIKSNIISHIKNILMLRQKHFNIGIVLSPGQLIKSALYLKFANIPVRIGNSYSYKQNPQSDKFLTHAIPELEHIHDVEQNLRLLEPLGIHGAPISHYSLHIPQHNIDEAKDYKHARFNGGLKAKSYVGLHAGCAAGFEFKQWPLERFAEIAKKLIEKHPNIKILVFGGPDEEAQKQELVRMINGKAAGKTPGVSPLTPGVEEAATSISASLLTTAVTMQHCKLFISNDSGLMHLAASVRVPVLGIFGPTDERQTGPRGAKNNYVVRAPGTVPVYNTEKNPDIGTSPHPTLLALTPQVVLNKIEEIKENCLPDW